MARQPFNTKRAKELYDANPKATYRSVGVALAQEEGRRVAYSIETVARALNRLET